MTKRIPLVARVLLGLVYFVFGLNGLLHFLPMTPPPMAEAGMKFMEGMMAVGYFLPLLAFTQAFFGFLLLIGWGAPLALVVLAPVTLQIFMFHLFITPGAPNLVLPVVMGLCHLSAASAYKNIYAPLFSKGK